MRFAVPLAEGLLCNHFGHCQQFAILTVDGGDITQQDFRASPPHEPGTLPRWLHELGVDVIIAAGMGRQAMNHFFQRGIQVITGAPNLPPDVLIRQYLDQALQTGPNVCDH